MNHIKNLYMNMIYIAILMLCLIFYVLSSELILNGELSSFEIMISALIFFSTLFGSVYILFSKINLNGYVLLGSFFIWVKMIFYNIDFQILYELGNFLIVFGIVLGILEMFGIELDIKFKYKKKIRNIKTKRTGGNK